MVQELLPLLPREAGTAAVVTALAGVGVGVLLWAMGSRFSRSLMTLWLVSAGGWVGLYLPTWYGWKIDGWAPAIGLAVVLGASGFFMQRVWVGMGLGFVLAMWAVVAVWFCSAGGVGWSVPRFDVPGGPVGMAKDLWQSLPGGVQKFLPYAGGAAAVSGLVVALIWARVGLVTFYSALGGSLMVGLGLWAASVRRPEWVEALPAKSAAQVVTFLALVAFGALLQWQIGPSASLKAPGGGKEEKPRKVKVV